MTFGPNSLINLPRPAAVKASTTDNYRDTWTIGYTPNIAVGVWVGNTDSHPMREVLSSMSAGKVWREAVDTAIEHYNSAEDFQRPPGLVDVEVCGDTGMRAPSPHAIALFPFEEASCRRAADRHAFGFIDAGPGARARPVGAAGRPRIRRSRPAGVADRATADSSQPASRPAGRPDGAPAAPVPAAPPPQATPGPEAAGSARHGWPEVLPQPNQQQPRRPPPLHRSRRSSLNPEGQPKPRVSPSLSRRPSHRAAVAVGAADRRFPLPRILAAMLRVAIDLALLADRPASTTTSRTW